MEPRPLSYVLDACQGRWVQGDPGMLVSSLSTDSRQVKPGDLFFALKGDRFDGHDFLLEVAATGAAALVVQRGVELPVSCTVLEVDDTRVALGRLAARYRAGFNPSVIAVAGSNGKTTTKDLLASVLSQRRTVLASPASYNNDIGVPLTLLSLDRRHEAAVVEVGTNHPGELAPLVRMVRPEMGVLTSLGREHLEFFGNVQGVIQEEGWLAELLPAHGRLFLNGDCPGMEQVRARTSARTVRVGLAAGNDWQAEPLHMDEEGVRFRARSPERHFCGEYRMRLMGRHQLTNALLALAVAEDCGISPEDARRGLWECPVPRMRMQLRRLGGVRLLDDSYNANADSVRAALETLRELPCSGLRWAVLGEMAELGRHAEAAHLEVGRRAGELRLNRLVTIGRWGQATADAARQAGIEWVHVFAGVEPALEVFPGWLQSGDAVLVKGSRVSGLERLVAALQEHFKDAKAC